MSCLAQVIGTELSSSARAGHTVTAEPPLQPQLTPLNLHFHGGIWPGASFHMLICCLCFSSSGDESQIFGSFFLKAFCFLFSSFMINIFSCGKFKRSSHHLEMRVEIIMGKRYNVWGSFQSWMDRLNNTGYHFIAVQTRDFVHGSSSCCFLHYVHLNFLSFAFEVKPCSWLNVPATLKQS